MNPPRIEECQVQLEATVAKTHRFSDNSLVPMFAFELSIIQCHIEESILMGDKKQYVDPDEWHPLIMSFRKFYTTNDYIHPSRLNNISVEKYRVREMKGLVGGLVKNMFSFLYREHRKL